MKKILAVMVAVLCMSTLSAKQCVKYFRYNFSLNVAESASTDLESLIRQETKSFRSVWITSRSAW